MDFHYVVTEEVRSLHESRRFIVPLPEGRGPQYRQRKSMYWFRQRERKRFVNNVAKSGLFYTVREDAIQQHHLEMQKIVGDIPLLQTIVCNDVFDFYEKIGYDRHAQKFLPHSDVADEKHVRNAVHGETLDG